MAYEGKEGEVMRLRTRVLVPLKHKLRIRGLGIPELHAAILGATQDPLSIGGQCDTEHEVLSLG